MGFSELTWGLIAGGGVIVLVGIVDDFAALSPLVKLVGQVAAALVLVGFDVRIDFISNPIGGGLLQLGWLAVPLTVLWIVAMTNMVNLIDGLDGLAAGVASIAAITLLLAAVRMNYQVGVLLTAALAGSALGFLPYNFNPAKIFMGDAGAMFLGFGLAAVAVEGALKSTATLAVAIPVLAVGLPIFDTVFAIFRRLKRGVPISVADRDHLHHRLLRLGLSHRETVIVMYFVSGWLGISALALMELGTFQALAIIAFVVTSVYLGAKKVGVLDVSQGSQGD
jgi:UDP-GlcNAc:undecaprenyl-phosphate GlcNAc-1-phosphate transferase